MIPSITGFLEQDFELEEQPTYTYKMNLDTGSIRGYTDGLDAMKQAIFKFFKQNAINISCIAGIMGLKRLTCTANPFPMYAPNWNAGSQKPCFGMNELKALITLNLTFRRKAWFMCPLQHIPFSGMCKQKGR